MLDFIFYTFPLVVALFLFLFLRERLPNLLQILRDSLPASETASKKPRDLRYRPAPFESQAELKFFFALETFVAGRARIFSKVRLADLAQPVPGQRFTWQTAFNRISAKHVDFVLCNSNLNPLCVIELDDSSHQQDDRIRRDEFVDGVLQDIGLPVFHVPVRWDYKPADFDCLKKVLTTNKPVC